MQQPKAVLAILTLVAGAVSPVAAHPASMAHHLTLKNAAASAHHAGHGGGRSAALLIGGIFLASMIAAAAAAGSSNMAVSP
ncbi:MAG: hypothetical protein KGL21_06620 [Alphaproteobacteria bacterium]|nr:hypothetical protein [Alphaproteobacteria bacterium]